MPRFKLVASFFGLLFLVACSGGTSQPEVSVTSPVTTASPDLAPLIQKMIQRITKQDGCKDFTAEMQMTAEANGGKREHIEFRIQRKYGADGAKTFLTVLTPKEESNKAILALEHTDKPTEAFSYLSGLKKIAKLSSEKQLGFRGAKVTVQELLGMELGHYAQGPAEAAGEGMLKVVFTADPECQLAFPRIVGYFREKNQNPVRFELFDAANEVQKRLTIEEIKEIQSRLTITRVTIEDLHQKFHLKLETRKVEYDRNLSDKLFTEDHLKTFVTDASRRLDQ